VSLMLFATFLSNISSTSCSTGNTGIARKTQGQCAKPSRKRLRGASNAIIDN